MHASARRRAGGRALLQQHRLAQACLRLGLDILSLDVRLSLDAGVGRHRCPSLRFLASGATLSLGIVPTNVGSEFHLGELVDSVEAALRATLPGNVSLAHVVSRMILTPACGLAMRTVQDAERIFSEVREAQRRLRELAELDSAVEAPQLPS